MDEKTDIPVPPTIELAVRESFAGAGCRVETIIHRVSDTSGMTVGPATDPDWHHVHIDAIAWSPGLHERRTRFDAGLSLQHTLNCLFGRLKGADDRRGDIGIEDLDEEGLLDLFLESMGPKIDKQRFLRIQAAALGIDEPIRYDVSTPDPGPMVVDRSIAEIMARMGLAHELPEWIARFNEPGDVIHPGRTVDTGNGPMSITNGEPGQMAPQFRLEVPIHVDETSGRRIRYDGFTLKLEIEQEWPETLLMNLSGRRLGDVVETGIPFVDERTILSVARGENEYMNDGVYRFELSADAVPLRDAFPAVWATRTETVPVCA